MLAAVSSRAFGIGNHDDNYSSIVPLLDLCTHSRGKGDKKNLSYQWNEEKDRCVQVTSTDMIDTGGLLQITGRACFIFMLPSDLFLGSLGSGRTEVRIMLGTRFFYERQRSSG
jgi:hypothetical protein